MERILPPAVMDGSQYLRLFGSQAHKQIPVADRILAHQFDLLGSGEVALGAQIDWHRDFKSGYRWPVRYYRTLKLVRFDDNSDVKVPWELSRFQHLFTLGKAYWLTQDEKYAQEFRAQIESWVAANPFKKGVNWQCAMEVAIRAVNWIVAANFFRTSTSCDLHFWRNFLRTLYLHGKFIRKNLEWHAQLRGNHYLSDVVGLIWLGAFFRDTSPGQEWLHFGRDQLVLEMHHQVNPDGTDYESSNSYHRLVTELFVAGALALARNADFFGTPLASGGPSESGEELDCVRAVCGADFVDRLRGMFDFIFHYTRPDGLAPQVGDADDGRLWFPVGYGVRHPGDHRHLLAVGARLFSRSDWLAAGDDAEESWWTLGRQTRFPGFRTANYTLTPSWSAKAQSRAFPDGGFFRLSSQQLWVFARCGSHGMRGVGGHTHCDQLSFELTAVNEPVIIDPGAYVYSASPAARDLFRSTAYHNTVRVDQQEQNRFSRRGMFHMVDDARAEVTEWTSNPETDQLVGEHYGYCRLASPVVHRRALALDKRSHSLEVMDQFRGKGAHLLEWFFHLAPGIVPRPPEGHSVSDSPGNGGMVFALGKRVHLTWELPPQVKVSLETGSVSSRYGVRHAASVLVFRAVLSLPLEAKFRIGFAVD
jgi:hypothetical protein